MCMRARQYSWMARAAHEQAFAHATWFLTFTFRPSERVAVAQAASSAGQQSTKSSTKRLVAAAGDYVSAYMKSLRKADFAFRYVCVPELHQDGFPHFHGLIHDLRGTMTWEVLTDSWSAGFSVVKIVRDANALRYVTKYLSKEYIGRVRASLNYGSPQPVEKHEWPVMSETKRG